MTLTSGPGWGRRRFLHQVGITVASLASSRLTEAFNAVADDPPIVLGSGKQRYEWVRGWGTLPAGMKYGNMHGGVAVDSQNRVYFSTDGDQSIIVFDRDGKYVRSIGKEWKPDEPSSGLLAKHPGLIVARVPETVAAKFPSGTVSLYAVDPLGNLVLAWPAEPDIKGIARDLTRLLKASRIG